MTTCRRLALCNAAFAGLGMVWGWPSWLVCLNGIVAFGLILEAWGGIEVEFYPEGQG